MSIDVHQIVSDPIMDDEIKDLISANISKSMEKTLHSLFKSLIKKYPEHAGEINGFAFFSFIRYCYEKMGRQPLDNFVFEQEFKNQ